MAKNSGNITPIAPMMKNAFGVGLLLLFLFAFAADLAATRFERAIEGTCIKSSQYNDWPYHGVHLPFGSKPALPGSEAQGENEVEKEIDADDDVHASSQRSVIPILIQDACASLQLRHRMSFQDHPGVSKVILYHSWKGYLS
jgi:hypothetical protein